MERVAVENENEIEPDVMNDSPEPVERIAVENGNEIELKKKRKKYEAVEHNGYIWHVNKSVKEGKTVYLDCAQ